MSVIGIEFVRIVNAHGDDGSRLDDALRSMADRAYMACIRVSLRRHPFDYLKLILLNGYRVMIQFDSLKLLLDIEKLAQKKWKKTIRNFGLEIW